MRFHRNALVYKHSKTNEKDRKKNTHTRNIIGLCRQMCERTVFNAVTEYLEKRDECDKNGFLLSFSFLIHILLTF